MIAIMGNVPTSKTSHNAGWALVCKSILSNALDSEVEILNVKDDWDEYDLLIINEGVNYKPGSYNFIGGVDEKVLLRLEKLNNYKGRIVAMNLPVDYNEMCQKRNELKHLSCVHKNIPVLDLLGASDKLVLGDSHTISAFKPGHTISRNDGKTLNGFLKIGIKNYIPENMKELIFYAGNIDIRFHIDRFHGVITIDDLVERLEEQLSELKLDKISVVGLIPIETEERKIPKSGQHKGNNFYGSREIRTHYVKYFNECLIDMCKYNDWEFLEWNFNYELELPLHAMESRQSVHIRPEYYMFLSPHDKFNIN